MKKKLLALSLSAIMILALAACGGKPTSTSTPDSTPTSTSTESAAPAADGKTYTTSINDADVTLTLSADEKSIVVDAMGMTVEGSCEVVDGVLTLKEQTSGNAQVWTSLASRPLKLNEDGTATEVGGSAGAEKTYTTTINDADVTLTISADQKSIVVDAMGMTVEGSCEVVDGVLALKEQTSGNAQIWASLASHSLTLNDDGTATEGGGSAGAEKTYTTTINDADVTLTISADQKSVVVDAMGMTVEGSCEVVDGVLALKEQTSGNAQIWASLASLSLKLNDDGTATAGGAQ